jgi:hypothetical protein
LQLTTNRNKTVYGSTEKVEFLCPHINPHLFEGNTQPPQYHAEESLFPDKNLPMQRIQQEFQDVHIPPWEKPLERSIMNDWKGGKEKRLDEKNVRRSNK